jgi:hypothetical protein
MAITKDSTTLTAALAFTRGNVNGTLSPVAVKSSSTKVGAGRERAVKKVKKSNGSTWPSPADLSAVLKGEPRKPTGSN